ncbi:MAG: aspartyl protease family protein [Acidobacteria bacterium]|nr:aspartyl protease family protein [Acidobacteriota bacterium]
MPVALEEYFTENGFEIPAPVTGYALIDTGATSSAVHEPILQQLSILPIDSSPTSTPSGEGRSFVYPARVSFPGLRVGELRMDRVIGSQLDWGTPDGRTIVMLLGRDLLKHFLMVYNGPGSNITLAF